jgi:glycosyltransferase involved in cell wall biosynthesis
MKIIHVGSSPSPQSVDGVNYTVWSVAEEQIKLGHQVGLLVDSPPDDQAKGFCQQIGIDLTYIPSHIWGYNPTQIANFLQKNAPDLIHMHSVFLPKYATLAKALRKRKIPYVITPHAMSPQLLKRGWFKKSIYSWLIEKPRFRNAGGIAVVTPREEIAVRDFVPSYQGVVRWVPNPVNPDQLSDLHWSAAIDKKRLVYLGRFDVVHKGIDVLIEIASHLPSKVELHLYGTEDKKTANQLRQLKQNLPENVYFRGPVFGEEKARVLAEASLYIQASRWEVFGISIAEAMYLGVPCAIANTLNLADLFEEHDLGLVFPSAADVAAQRIMGVLEQPDQLYHWSRQARTYVKEHFLPREVAQGYLSLYQEVLQT